MAFAVSDDAELLLSAMAYIEAVHKDVTSQHTFPAPVVGECVLAVILGDPALSDYVRAWGRSTKINGADWTPDEPPRPPIDATYQRIRDLLRTCGDKAQVAVSCV